MRKLIIGLILGGVLAGAASAGAATEQTAIAVPSSYLAINPTTCRFLHHEVDPPLGQNWLAGRVYVAMDDARHDVLDQCIRKLAVQKPKAGAPGPRGPQGPAGVSGYIRVSAPINFHQASASVSCPAGDKVLGGGADVEVAGSYPSSDTTWSVTRDAVWASHNIKTGSVYAICGKAS